MISRSGVLVCAAVVLCSLTAAGAAAPEAREVTLKLSNPLPRARKDAPVVVKRAQLEIKDGEHVRSVTLAAEKTVLPIQVDDMDKDGAWDELFFLVDIGAKAELGVSIEVGDAPPEPGKTKARVSARIDGSTRPTKQYPAKKYPRGFRQPAWESELMGYRMYGSTQMDYFAKTSPQLCLHRFFRKGGLNHHKFNRGVGMDCLFVGQTMGGHAIFVRAADGSIDRPWTSNAYFFKPPVPEDARYDFDTVASGPLRAIQRTRITEWKTSRGSLSCTLVYEIHAGSRHTIVDLRFDGPPGGKGDFQAGAGIGVLPEDDGDPIKGSGYLGVMAKGHTVTGHTVKYLARGLIFPAAWKAEHVLLPNDESLTAFAKNGPNYAVLFPKGKTHLRHAFAGAWDTDGGCKSREQWERHLKNVSESMDSPLVVELSR